MEEPFGLRDYSDGEPTFSLDPVCGMKVNEAEAPGGKTQYAGQTYYFCSDICRKNFELDPAKFIAQGTQP
jgi:YHS domain-containing protein